MPVVVMSAVLVFSTLTR